MPGVRIHALETGKVQVREAQRAGRGAGPLRPLNTLLDREWTERLPILAWAIEHPEGTIVVDTGETARASEPGWFPRWHPYFRLAVRMHCRPDDELGPALRRAGIEPADVRLAVLTHLHTDHVGGVRHLEGVEALVSAEERDVAFGPLAKLRGYLPHRCPEWFRPRAIEWTDEPYGPFTRSAPLTGAGDVRVVPTPGHTPGHVSVVVEQDDGGCVFLAGDVSYTEELMLRGVVDGVAPDAGVAADTLARVKRLAEQRPLVYLPAHDPGAPERLAARTPAVAHR